MAHEVTGAARKHGRSRGGRTPLQLLADAVDTYGATAMARWWEWEQASDGRRQLTWSRGNRDLRALAGPGPLPKMELGAVKIATMRARRGRARM